MAVKRVRISNSDSLTHWGIKGMKWKNPPGEEEEKPAPKKKVVIRSPLAKSSPVSKASNAIAKAVSKVVKPAARVAKQAPGTSLPKATGNVNKGLNKREYSKAVVQGPAVPNTKKLNANAKKAAAKDAKAAAKRNKASALQNELAARLSEGATLTKAQQKLNKQNQRATNKATKLRDKATKKAQQEFAKTMQGPVKPTSTQERRAAAAAKKKSIQEVRKAKKEGRLQGPKQETLGQKIKRDFNTTKAKTKAEIQRNVKEAKKIAAEKITDEDIYERMAVRAGNRTYKNDKKYDAKISKANVAGKDTSVLKAKKKLAQQSINAKNKKTMDRAQRMVDAKNKLLGSQGTTTYEPLNPKLKKKSSKKKISHSEELVYFRAMMNEYVTLGDVLLNSEKK